MAVQKCFLLYNGLNFLAIMNIKRTNMQMARAKRKCCCTALQSGFLRIIVALQLKIYKLGANFFPWCRIMFCWASSLSICIVMRAACKCSSYVKALWLVNMSRKLLNHISPSVILSAVCLIHPSLFFLICSCWCCWVANTLLDLIILTSYNVCMHINMNNQYLLRRLITISRSVQSINKNISVNSNW